ncbi:uncharacterized protein LOC124673305 [Lolium rigidum]|uniref:uncharacterized protein LOC124673305 n=1 Tax=Lolium rigidum TaxID=89674 RepID=UPI001F5D2F3B|nr:uncharacterized protein LOC124673305 [Lolium rigidum]
MWMAPRSCRLLLFASATAISCLGAATGSGHYSFPVFDGKSTTDGVVVVTNSSMLAPATFLFDAQLFPEFNESEGFVLLARAVALWRAAADGTRDEASFNTSFTVDGSDAVAFVVLLDSFPPFNSKNRKPPRDRNGPACLSAVAPASSAGANSLAAVEVGTVSSYGPRPPPGVGLNVTITPNSSSAAGASQLAVRIEYNASVHRLSVYVGDSTPALLDAPLDLAGRLPAQDALVGFFAATVRDVVVGVSGWELTVDALSDDDGNAGPPRQHDDEQSARLSPSSRLAILLAVLGSVAAVCVAVVSVMLYRVVSRRRAVDMEVQKCYKDYFARTTH